MGFFKTFIKTAVTWSPEYVKRYEYSQIIKGAILELCKKDGYRAYLLAPYKSPIAITLETDITDEVLSDISIEINPKNEIKTIYIGIGKSDSQVLKDWRSKKISDAEKNKYYVNKYLYNYESSFDAYRDIKEFVNKMIESQIDDTQSKVKVEKNRETMISSAFTRCEKCNQLLNIPNKKGIAITCSNCNHQLTT